MLRTRIKERLREELPSTPFEYFEDRKFAVLRGHPSVGDVTLLDDGDELTMEVGSITHHHFNPYDPSLTESEAAEIIGSQLIEFIRALVADEVLMWKTVGGGGGCRHIESDEVLPRPGIGVEFYLWSRPLQ
jgi:hypothetical protein